MMARAGRWALALSMVLGVTFLTPGSAHAVGLTYSVDTVTDAGDVSPGDGVCDDGTGACPLRAAIQEANASATTDAISFALPIGPATIAPGQDLPTISGPVSILGATQPGAQPLPRITIDASGAAGLAIASDGVTIDAVVITGADVGIDVTSGRQIVVSNDVLSGNGDGIRLTGPAQGSPVPALEVALNGDRIGTDPSGSGAAPNTRDGVHVRGGVDVLVGDDVLAHRNVISGNGDDGIDTRDSWGTQTIEGARIGVDLAGSVAIPNGGWGADVDTTSVGAYGTGVLALPIATCAGACNVVSGNLAGGVRAFGGSVSGNVIGLDETATNSLPNQPLGVSAIGSFVSNNVVSGNASAGIRLDGGGVSQNYVGVDGTGTTAVPNGDGSSGSGGIIVLDGNVGFSNPGTGNIIGGNNGPGIVVTGNAFRSYIRGNLIGLDRTGTTAIPNDVGVAIKGNASEVTVGDFLPGEPNTIAGNDGVGVAVGGAGGSHVRYNAIGVATDGSPLGNDGAGVVVTSSGNDVTNNRIVGSAGPAISVLTATETGITENTFAGNDGPSIDLGGDGASPNDPGDLDEGADHGLNAPVIDQVDTFGDRTLVHYHLDAAPEGGPDAGTVVEFYRDDACGPIGQGTGSHFVMQASVLSDGTGLAKLPHPLPTGAVVSATRTEGTQYSDPSRSNTSEFSTCGEQLMHPADDTPPTIGIAWPADGATYTAGLDGVLSFTCDDGVGSGVALCLADGYPSGSLFAVGDAGVVTLTVRAVDRLGNESTKTISYTVVAGTASADLDTGGIVSTDPSGIGATRAAPIQTELWSGTGGHVDIGTRDRTTLPPVPFQYLDKEVQIVAPDSTNIAAAQMLTFRIDGPRWDREADRIRLFHDGVLVPWCQVATGVADPDPCAMRGVRLPDGDVQVRAYAMSPAGTWNIGWRVAYAFAFAPPTQGRPTVNVVQKNSLIPTWFTLGGNQGLDIFLHAPTWREVPCWPNAPQHLVARSHDQRLSYDPLTDRYEYVKSYSLNWVGTCRVMRMTFVDGTVARARYRLR